jgi:hypothetical protein
MIGFRTLLLAALIVAPALGKPAHASPPRGGSAVDLSPDLRLSTASPGNRFALGQPVIATWFARNTSDRALTFDETGSVTDYFGAETALPPATISLQPGQSSSSTLRARVSGSGYYVLTLTLTDQASNQTRTATMPLAVLRRDRRSAWQAPWPNSAAIHACSRPSPPPWPRWV